MKLLFQGVEKECYASVMKVQITANKKWINLVLIYGLGETPMMLASNIPINSCAYCRDTIYIMLKKPILYRPIK